MTDELDYHYEGDEDAEHIAKIFEACSQSRVYFIRHVLKVEHIEKWQLKVLNALDNGALRISIRSGHGVGKTALCAWVILHFILFRTNVKIPVTAPSSKQLDDGLIPECHLWIAKMPQFLQDMLHTTEKRIERADDGENNFVSFRTARADAPEALAGIHAAHVLAVVDEASGVPEPVYEAAQGTMSTPGAIFMLIGNPTRPKGYFHKTHTILKHKWLTMKVACHDSSRVDHGFIDEVAAAWGVDSNQYRVRVLGEFPGADKDALIPYELASSAVMRDVDVIPSAERIWGVDPGRGGDPTGFAERVGNVLTEVEEWDDLDLMKIVGRIKTRWDKLPEHERPVAIYVDSIGLGAGVADRLRELDLPAVDVNVSESAALKNRYVRLRAELWYTVREWLEGRACSIKVSSRYRDQLVEELCEPEAIYTSSGKSDVESKQSMKARGVKSPNLADAVCHTFAFAGAVNSGRSPKNAQSWNKPLEVNTDFVH